MMKGQSSLEMFVMIGVAIVFIFPLALMFFTTSGVKVEDIGRLQAQNLANAIADESGKVCYQEMASKRVVLLNYPEKILNLTVNGTEVVITLEATNGGQTQITAQSPCKMNDALNSGGAFVSSKSIAAVKHGRFVSGGLVALVFYSRGTNVTIFRAIGNNYNIG
jgi:hypothetical protein